MDIGHTKLRAAALSTYAQAPVYCKQCGVQLAVPEGRSPSVLRGRSFCSQHCAAVFNNRQRKDASLTTCKFCGAPRDRRAASCARCWSLQTVARNEQRAISTLFNHGSSKVKYARIRALAVRAMQLWNIPRHCAHCATNEFDSVVEVHHIRAIRDYPADTLLGIVNARDNLQYLCPSHHALVTKKENE